MSTKIGRFEILSEICKSPSGSVYKANDPGAGRTIALKTIRLTMPAEHSRILVQLILQEAESTKILNSQNIALLYGAGEVEGQFCAAMEYVEGNTLSNMIARQEGFSIWDVMDISRQVCLALDHASSKGVVHRALEPGKLMVQWDGTLKILGYGLSTMASAIPKDGSAVAPLFHYMSPEQVRGEDMDVRSNIFSWGAMLYEMVTDRKAFDGPDLNTVRQKILEETPEPPASINPRINLSVSRVIMQALAKSPEERYEQGQQLLAELEKAKEATPPAAQASPAHGLVVPSKLKPAGSQKSTAPAAPVQPASAANAPPGKRAESAAPARRVEQGRTPAKEDGAQQHSTGAAAIPPARKAAAAGWGGSRTSFTTTQKPAGATAPQTSLPRVPVAGAARGPQNLSAAVEPAATEKYNFNVDPLMAEQGENAPKKVSFSDLDELPPLKEEYVAPPEPPLLDLDEDEPEHATAKQAPVPPSRVPERARVATRQNAKKAVREISQVPPRLALYAVSAAVVIILVVITGLALHFRDRNADEGPAVPTPAVTVQTPVQEEPVAPAEPIQAAPAEPEEAAVNAPEVEVRPRYPVKQRKVAARPARAVMVPGEVSINSTPEGAQIQIDGRSDANWITPYNLTGLTPGQHSIGVRKPGYTSEVRMLDVSSGSKSFLVVHLTQLGATASVTSQPAGALVFIDGKNTGKVTPTQVAVEKGTHTLLVRKEGYLDETTTTDLAPGQTFHFSPALRALGITEDIKIGGGKFKKLFGGGDSNAGMGKIVVKTQPKGAQITVNRRMVDKPAPVDFYLNPGNYIIDITLSGYKPLHRVISVEKGSKLEINETLVRQ